MRTPSYTERQTDAELYLIAALEFYVADGWTDEQITEKVKGELPDLREVASPPPATKGQDDE